MSNDGKQPQNQPARAPDLGSPPRFEPIRVKSIQFRDNEITLALTSFSRCMVAGKQRSKSYLTVEIWLEPWQRMYRIRETNTEDGKNTRTEICVPESWASYVPEGA